MGPITVQIEIDVPRELAYDFIADLANRPAFTAPYHSAYHLERIDSTGVGASVRFRTTPGGTWMTSEIAELQPPHRILERGRGGRLNRVPTVTVWELVEQPGGATRVSLTFLTRPERFFDQLAERLARATRGHRRGWQASLHRLREVLEGPAGATPRVRVAGGNRHRTGVA
ncbi:MAG TPA: SRPBCC family protein [Solirubrobacterales bacterium]|nr:SRPBCC family protein [Solirubrobacterales bacterium]